MKVNVYEVGPRDGIQYLKRFVPTEKKKNLITLLYDSGIADIEEVSFAHPKRLPQMADAEEVFTGKGAGLVMNKRGFDRAISAGVEKINIVFSPCETFNMKNMGKTRSGIVLMYRTFMDKYPKDKVRVYISMAFGSPHSGQFSPSTIKSCIKDASMFGDTVVLSDTVGAASHSEVALWAELVQDAGLNCALHLHHKGEESRAVSLVKTGLLAGIKEFDSSIGGLGGCPFAEGSGANISTETLVRHLHAWDFETDIDESKLEKAGRVAYRIGTFFNTDTIPSV